MEVFYDLEHDWALIEASFAMQYGIRLALEDMAFGEFCRLLSGLMGDTPLGRVVRIRAEKEHKVIMQFGEYEKKIRKDWREFLAEAKGSSSGALDVAGLESFLDEAFRGV